MERYTVLMVDDEQNILTSLKRLFRKENVEILTAPNGKEALELFKTNKIQVLLTDNIMPEMNGIELVKHVRDISPSTVRIVLSGQSQMDAVLDAINTGEVYRFILKPWNDIDLKTTVMLALAHYKLTEDHKRLQRELQEKSQLLDLLAKKHPELFSYESNNSLIADGVEIEK